MFRFSLTPIPRPLPCIQDYPFSVRHRTHRLYVLRVARSGVSFFSKFEILEIEDAAEHDSLPFDSHRVLCKATSLQFVVHAVPCRPQTM
jgi:hypothetical protein